MLLEVFDGRCAVRCALLGGIEVTVDGLVVSGQKTRSSSALFLPNGLPSAGLQPVRPDLTHPPFGVDVLVPGEQGSEQGDLRLAAGGGIRIRHPALCGGLRHRARLPPGDS